MKILITGAAGFIGSALSRYLSLSGHEVVGLDNYANYYSQNLKQLRVKALVDPLNIKVVDLDLSNKENIERFINTHEFDTVVHLAAQAGVRLSQEKWDRYIEDNLIGFSNLLLACTQKDIKNFIYASSSSVYGNSDGLNGLAENSQEIEAVSLYGATKRCNELLAKVISKSTGIKTRGLRFFTVYGPWGRPDMVYFRIVNSILNNRKLTIFGDGNIKRDFTFIQDVVHTVTLLINELNARSSGFSDIVNVGGGRPRSINELIELSEELTNVKLSYIKIDGDKNDVLITSADYRYLESLIGTFPEVSLEQGMRRFFEWAKSDDIIRSLDRWTQSVQA